MLPSRLRRTATPRWLSLITQSLTTTSRIGPPTSQPNTIPQERERSVHPEMRTFSQGRVMPSLSGAVLSEMQSSPVDDVAASDAHVGRPVDVDPVVVRHPKVPLDPQGVDRGVIAS